MVGQVLATLPSGSRLGPLIAAGALLLAACGTDPEQPSSGGAAPAQPLPKVESKDDLRLLYARGRKAEDRQIYEVAERYYRAVSEAGYAPGSVALGRLYSSGVPGFPQDYQTSAFYFQRAVDQGAGYDAELPLGYHHLKGLGLPPDPGEAERWFRRGALTVAGLERSQAEGGAGADADALTARFFAPNPTPAEFAQALAWARGLAGQEAELLYRDSLRYREGGDLVTDLALADRLRQIAADKGHLGAAYDIGRDSLDANDKEARDKGVQMLWRAAEGGLLPARIDLATYYANASSHDFNQERAYYWLRRAEAEGADSGGLLEQVRGRLPGDTVKLVERNLEIGWVYPP